MLVITIPQSIIIMPLFHAMDIIFVFHRFPSLMQTDVSFTSIYYLFIKHIFSNTFLIEPLN